MRIRILIICGVVLVAVGAFYFLGSNYAADNVLPYALLRPTKLMCMKGESNASIRVDDSTSLSANYKHTTSAKRGTIILLHGVAACKTQGRHLAKEFLEDGFDVFLVDMRAHGLSDGLNCTYGYREKYDVKKCVDWLIANDSSGLPIGIYGSSLGGAIAVQAMSIDDRIAFGIIESTFSSLRTVSRDYAHAMSWFLSDNTIDKALSNAERIAKFSVDSVSPAESMRHVRQQILHVHGSDDERISIDHAYRIEENVRYGNSEFHVLNNARHLDMFKVGGEHYRTLRRDFLNRVTILKPKA